MWQGTLWEYQVIFGKRIQGTPTPPCPWGRSTHFIPIPQRGAWPLNGPPSRCARGKGQRACGARLPHPGLPHRPQAWKVAAAGKGLNQLHLGSLPSSQPAWLRYNFDANKSNHLKGTVRRIVTNIHTHVTGTTIHMNVEVSITAQSSLSPGLFRPILSRWWRKSGFYSGARQRCHSSAVWPG